VADKFLRNLRRTKKKGDFLDLQSDKIKEIYDSCLTYEGEPISRHNDINHFLHKIGLLLDAGYDNKDEGMKRIAEMILSNQSQEGAFLSQLQISANYGGTGLPESGWMICDFPLLLNFLIKMGYKKDDRVIKAINYLINLSDENGWRCKSSFEKFRGPGRKEDHCPLATLYALKVFSLLPEYHNDQFVKNGINAMLYHWRISNERKIYMFGMGKNFRKLKYPTHWFDIVHVVRVLANFEYAKGTQEFKEMIGIIKSKKTQEGDFIPESVFTAYKGWDFGQKKSPSSSLSNVINEILDKV